MAAIAGPGRSMPGHYGWNRPVAATGTPRSGAILRPWTASASMQVGPPAAGSRGRSADPGWTSSPGWRLWVSGWCWDSGSCCASARWGCLGAGLCRGGLARSQWGSPRPNPKSQPRNRRSPLRGPLPPQSRPPHPTIWWSGVSRCRTPGGRARIVLSCDDAGVARLEIRDGGGTGRVTVEVASDGTAAALLGTADGRGIYGAVPVDPQLQPSFSLLDQRGKARMMLGLANNEEAPFLDLLDRDGQARINLRLDGQTRGTLEVKGRRGAGRRGDSRALRPAPLSRRLWALRGAPRPPADSPPTRPRAVAVPSPGGCPAAR